MLLVLQMKSRERKLVCCVSRFVAELLATNSENCSDELHQVPLLRNCQPDHEHLESARRGHLRPGWFRSLPESQPAAQLLDSMPPGTAILDRVTPPTVKIDENR